MTSPVDAWLRGSLDLLASFQFVREAVEILRNAPVTLAPAAHLAEQRGPRIVIPVDLPAPSRPSRVQTS